VLCIFGNAKTTAPRQVAPRTDLPAHSCATLFHAKSCHGNHDPAMLHEQSSYRPPILQSSHLRPNPIPPWSPLQEAASSLELLPQSLAIMGQHPTATNAQSSQIISFNVNTKPARSHRRQPPLQFLLLQVNALRESMS